MKEDAKIVNKYINKQLDCLNYMLDKFGDEEDVVRGVLFMISNLKKLEVSMSDNVKNIFDQPKKKKEESGEGYNFEEIMKRNDKNKSREAKERTKSNRGVIRSYRLKN